MRVYQDVRIYDVPPGKRGPALLSPRDGHCDRPRPPQGLRTPPPQPQGAARENPAAPALAVPATAPSLRPAFESPPRLAASKKTTSAKPSTIFPLKLKILQRIAQLSNPGFFNTMAALVQTMSRIHESRPCIDRHAGP
jgi:hypothetical protein